MFDHGFDFLRIRFSEPEPSLLAATITAPKANTRGSASKRDGHTLLMRSVEAAVPKGFTVEVLKPDSVLRDERVLVENMNDVFSGGQELTAAIVLYCTMAALRANERGQMRARHSGVLFLDNPIGKASAEYLLFPLPSAPANTTRRRRTDTAGRRKRRHLRLTQPHSDRYTLESRVHRLGSGSSIRSIRLQRR